MATQKKISSAINKTKPVFRYSTYFERTKKTQSKKRKKGAGSSNRKMSVHKKEGRTIGAALMKQKRRKYCCLKKIETLSIFLNLFSNGDDPGIPRYDSRIATREK